MEGANYGAAILIANGVSNAAAKFLNITTMQRDEVVDGPMSVAMMAALKVEYLVGLKSGHKHI